MLESALTSAAALLRISRENVRPADKRALRGVATALQKTIDRLATEPVRERLVAAIFEEPDGPEEDGINRYTAWWEAKERVDRALDGARDLLALVHAGEAFKGQGRQPQYDHWTVAIESLIDFWIHDLGRDVTISAHPNDPRGVKPSQAVRFVQRSMRLIGEEIPEQTCRTILDNLSDPEFTQLDAEP